jgi:hypothetical protein
MTSAVALAQPVETAAVETPAAETPATKTADVDSASLAGTYRAEVFTAGLWIEVDRFSGEQAARIFAERLVRVTRHQVARIVLCGMRVGGVDGVDSVLDTFEKPPPEQLKAEKQETAEAIAEAAEAKRKRWRNLILYGGSAFIGLLVFAQFNDKLKKVAAYLIW